MKRTNSYYKFLLMLSLALMPSTALAVEPVIDGTKTGTNVTLTAITGWNTLLTRQVAIPAGSIFHCAVTCSSTVSVPLDNDSQNVYRYATFNSTTLSSSDGCARKFSTPRKDEVFGGTMSHMAIANTCYIPNLSGTQTFYCLGGKWNNSTMNTFVDDTSMQVVCIDNQG